jgi:hypothetical protein
LKDTAAISMALGPPACQPEERAQRTQRDFHGVHDRVIRYVPD